MIRVMSPGDEARGGGANGLPLADRLGGVQPIPAVDTSNRVSVPLSPGGGDAAICPLLVEVDGPWRRAQPSRTHRCDARSPAPPIPALTQKRVCLTDAFVRCEYYVAAAAARAEALAADRVHPEYLDKARFRPMVRPLPLAIDLMGPPGTPGSWQRLRPIGLAAGALGLVLLLLVVGGSMLTNAPSGVAASRVGSAAPATSLAAGVPSRSTAPGSQAPAPPGVTSPPPSAGPSAPPAGGLRRYRVRRGDTLRSIARRFEVTVRVIVVASDLGTRPRIRTGQFLMIPLPTG